jgi:hypothetical protein
MEMNLLKYGMNAKILNSGTGLNIWREPSI